MSTQEEDPGAPEAPTHDKTIQILAEAIAAAIAAATSSASQSSAGAGTAGARTQSNAEQDSKLGVIDQQVDSDTGTEEAMAGLVHDTRENWGANRKRTYDLHQTVDMEGITEKSSERSAQVGDIRSLNSKLDTIDISILQNAATNADAAMKQHLRMAEAITASVINAHELAVHRMWNSVPVSSIARDVAEGEEEPTPSAPS